MSDADSIFMKTDLPPVSEDFPGIDVAAGVSRWRTHKKFALMLRLFRQEYGNYGERIAAASPGDARKLLHRLRGAAQMAGLNRLSVCADALEAQFGVQSSSIPSRNSIAVNTHLAALQAEMQVVRTSIDRLVSTEG